MEINVIFRGSMSITSKTQRKKHQREISLASHSDQKTTQIRSCLTGTCFS
jgi:hypothetical protein